MAGAGGAAKYISSKIKEKDQVCSSKFCARLFANIFVSGFSGVMFSLFVRTMTDDDIYHILAAGIGGYLGIELLNIVAEIIKSKFLNQK